MKKFIWIAILALLSVGCTDIRDEFNEIHKELDELRALIEKANTNIGALQTIVEALQDKDYVTGVTPIVENGETVGYTIAFSKSGVISIYHGQDGYTPQMGVKKDSDDIYYWTVDNEWLLDNNGNKIRAIGQDGQDGEDGKDAVTPQLKIENGYWFISYDNGQTWNELGKAKGEDGKDGDPMFSSVDCSNSDFVVLTLSNGQVIKLPTWSAFEALKEECKKMNANITALQTVVAALQDSDFVKDITPIYEGVEVVGYVISFSKSGDVTIFHGKNGQDGTNGEDGENGADGHTPHIGVKMDEDGVYYWTVDGEWLLDENQQKIRSVGQDGKDGEDGENGAQGEAGENGVTPQLKIENGLWKISYDNGETWTTLGAATGEAGAAGDSLFSSVDNTNSDYVVITLSNGQVIKLPTWSAFEALKEECKKINTNISALQTAIAALKDNDYVKSITKLYEGAEVIGYCITFSKSGEVTIFHGKDGEDGEDGKTPKMGVKKHSDGIYYWTVDGEWLLDSNNQKVKAVGVDGTAGEDAVTPQFKIEDGYWMISYDDGQNWTKLGKATSTTVQGGNSIFSDVVVNPDSIKFILADGNEFTVPRVVNVKISFDVQGEETGILPGREVVINYTLENATDETFVTAASNGIYTVRVEANDYTSGKIYVKAPTKPDYGYITVIVSDGSSFSFAKVINFYEEKMVFADGQEYSVSPKGATLTIPFSYNFEHDFKVRESDKSWISVSTAKTRAAMVDGQLTVTVAANSQESIRTGKIYVIPTHSTGEEYTEITINQSSAYFSIEQTKYLVIAKGETISTNIRSSRGLKAVVPNEAKDWVTAAVADLGNDNFKLNTTIRANSTDSKRSVKVSLYSEDGTKLLGTIEYVQDSMDNDDASEMILIVRANVANDFTASLALPYTSSYGSYDYDFYIDWGDGQAENLSGKVSSSSSSKTFSHKYDCSTPTSYTVKISGTMPLFAIATPCVTEVVQWGKTGLQTVSFESDSYLQTVAADEYGSFKNLTSISFKNCVNLKSLPEDLFRYASKITSFGSTFYGCAGLTSLPENLFKYNTNVTSFGLYDSEGAFFGCTGLTSLPENLFKYNTNVTSFCQTFYGCEGLASLPENLFKHNTNATEFRRTFYGCDGLTSLPENLFKHNTNVTEFNSTFWNCYGLKSLPENLFKYNTNVTSFKQTFYSCRELESIPVGLFDNNRKVANFYYTFNGCRKLTGESPYTIIDGVKYHLYERHLNGDQFALPSKYDGCFRFGEGLTDWEAINNNGWD